MSIRRIDYRVFLVLLLSLWFSAPICAFASDDDVDYTSTIYYFNDSDSVDSAADAYAAALASDDSGDSEDVASASESDVSTASSTTSGLYYYFNPSGDLTFIPSSIVSFTSNGYCRTFVTFEEELQLRINLSSLYGGDTITGSLAFHSVLGFGDDDVEFTSYGTSYDSVAYVYGSGSASIGYTSSASGSDAYTVYLSVTSGSSPTLSEFIMFSGYEVAESSDYLVVYVTISCTYQFMSDGDVYEGGYWTASVPFSTSDISWSIATSDESSDIATIVSNIYDTLSGTFAGYLSDISSQLSSLISKVQSAASSAASTVVLSLEDCTSSISALLTTVQSYLYDTYTYLTDTLYSLLDVISTNVLAVRTYAYNIYRRVHGFFYSWRYSGHNIAQFIHYKTNNTYVYLFGGTAYHCYLQFTQGNTGDTDSVYTYYLALIVTGVEDYEGFFAMIQRKADEIIEALGDYITEMVTTLTVGYVDEDYGDYGTSTDEGLSDLDSSISDSYDSYSAAESDLLDSADSYISDIDYDDDDYSLTGIAAAFSLVSSWFTLMLSAMGDFGLMVYMSLMVVFALYVIGFLRGSGAA